LADWPATLVEEIAIAAATAATVPYVQRCFI
jgi:hypothetical protein